MIKVLFYTRDFFAGGAEKVLIEYLKAIDKEKFDVTLMVRRKEGGFSQQFEALKKDGIKVRQCFDGMVGGRNVFSKAKNVLTLKLADWSEFRFPSLFYRLAIKEKYDAEIAFMHNESLSVIASSNNKRSKKLVWIHTDLRKLTTWKQYFRTRRRQKRFIEQFDHCICVSQCVADALYDLLKIKDNVSVIYNPIDRNRIISLSLETADIKKDGLQTVCAVGRLSWEKNFSMLIEAHKDLIEQGYRHRLYIVGDGPEKEKLQRQIQESAVEDTVVLAGFQQNPYPYILASDFLVCSSVYEGLHVVSQEALVLGKPIVSCCKVVKETFGTRECGIITENAKDALTEGIKRMLSDKELYESCLAEAKKRSEEYKEHLPHKQIEELLSK